MILLLVFYPKTRSTAAVILIAVRGPDHMVGVVVDHRLDHVEDIHVHVEGDQGRALDAVPDQGKGIGVVKDVQEIERGRALRKSLDLETENAKRLENDGDRGLSLDVVQDPEVTRKIKNILQRKEKTNRKSEKKRTRKKIILRLLHLKSKRKTSLQHPKRRNPGRLHRPEVILEVRDRLVNRREEVVLPAEGKHLNQLRAVRLVTLDVHHLQRGLERELLLVNVLAGPLVEVVHLKNVVGSQIHHRGAPGNEVQVVINRRVLLLKKDVDAHVHPYVDLHLPDHLLLPDE